MAEAAIAQLGLDEVLILIDAEPGHKAEVTDFSHRLEMARLAVQNHPKISADRLPLQRRPQNHRMSNVNELVGAVGDAELVLLMGEDSFLTLEHWDDYERLVQMFAFGVAKRGVHNLRTPILEDVKVRWIEMDPVPVSSSAIRWSIKVGQKPSELDPSVWNYIQLHHLYWR